MAEIAVEKIVDRLQPVRRQGDELATLVAAIVDALDAIRKSGKIEIHEPTKEERQKWMDAMLPVYKTVEPRIDRSVYKVLTVEASVAARKSFGGTAPANVARAVKEARRRFL